MTKVILLIICHPRTKTYNLPLYLELNVKIMEYLLIFQEKYRLYSWLKIT